MKNIYNDSEIDFPIRKGNRKSHKRTTKGRTMKESDIKQFERKFEQKPIASAVASAQEEIAHELDERAMDNIQNAAEDVIHEPSPSPEAIAAMEAAVANGDVEDATTGEKVEAVKEEILETVSPVIEQVAEDLAKGKVIVEETIDEIVETVEEKAKDAKTFLEENYSPSATHRQGVVAVLKKTFLFGVFS